MDAKAAPTPDNSKNVVQSVAKAFSVLRAFNQDPPELTVTEVAARADLDRGTAFRFIHTLASLGYLRPVPGGRRFRLSAKCLELGFSALAGRDLPAHAGPLLREVVPEVADAGSLGILDRGEVIYLERVQASLDRHGMDRRPGSRTGAYAAALGHAILAFLPREAQIEHLQSIERVKLSERTLTDLDELLARLEQVRAHGFALSDGENAYGLRTVAAPIFDTDGKPLAGLSLTIQADRMPMDAFVAAAVPVVRRLTAELTESVRLSLGAIRVTGYSR
jgi:IclR family transcriptional regulator, pca regulon regulatory protein